MSSGVRDPERLLGGALTDPQATNKKLKLLWVACGKDDFLLQQNQQFDELLTARGIRPSSSSAMAVIVGRFGGATWQSSCPGCSQNDAPASME